MTVITETELREMWQNGRGQLPVFPQGTRFSASAADFIRSHQLAISFASEAAPTHLRSSVTHWDKPGSFPVILTGPPPVCSECGQPVTNKPEHLTQVDAGHFAPKTHPRLVLRGRVDSLHALVMLTASIARRNELPELALHLDTLAAYCREIMSAEYHSRAPAPISLLGKNEEELHNISHWPDKFLGIQHIVPGPHDHEILHWLNVLRSQCREVEIMALQAYPQTGLEFPNTGQALPQALNRLSSAIYVLELYFQSGVLGWKVTGD